MENYANDNGNSNIVQYLKGDDFIVVRFKGGKHIFYKYTYASAGKNSVETMKYLAEQGSGLNSFISSKATRPDYEIKGNSLEAVL
jgi:hypothetical protein